ncbi:hypothetical protein COOONC_00694 [Cooperia oncophora]
MGYSFSKRLFGLEYDVFAKQLRGKIDAHALKSLSSERTTSKSRKKLLKWDLRWELHMYVFRREVLLLTGHKPLVASNFWRQSKDEYDVADVMHFLHVGFRCDGQPFPAVEGASLLILVVVVVLLELFVNALNLWLSCGAHVIVVNGPRAVEENSWDRLNAKTRSHINGYVDTYPSFLNQIHCLVPAEPGILSSTMACLKVGVVHNPIGGGQWSKRPVFRVSQTRKDYVKLDAVKIPKSMKPRGNPSEGRSAQSSGGPDDKGWPHFHLKRVEKRKMRSLERATAKKLDELKM